MLLLLMVYICEKRVKNRYGKVYRYGYLCESFRDIDGRPTHRVIRYLGRHYDKSEVMASADCYLREYKARHSCMARFLALLDRTRFEELPSKILLIELLAQLLGEYKFERRGQGQFVRRDVVIDVEKLSVLVAGKEGTVRIGPDLFDSDFLKALLEALRGLKGELRVTDFEH